MSRRPLAASRIKATRITNSDKGKDPHGGGGGPSPGRLRVAAGEDLAMLSQSLGQRGVAVDVQSTTTQGDAVEGRLQLRMPAG